MEGTSVVDLQRELERFAKGAIRNELQAQEDRLERMLQRVQRELVKTTLGFSTSNWTTTPEPAKTSPQSSALDTPQVSNKPLRSNGREIVRAD